MPVSRQGRVEHQKLNQGGSSAATVEFLVFNSITYVGEKVSQLPQKNVSRTSVDKDRKISAEAVRT